MSASDPTKASLRDRARSFGQRVRGVDPTGAREASGRGIADAKAVVQLTVDYIKQETKAPLQGLVRYLAFGAAAAVLLGTAGVLLALALLRGLQSALAYERVRDGVLERGPLSGHLSWVPYVLTLIGCGVLLALLRMVWRREDRPDTAGGVR